MGEKVVIFEMGPRDGLQNERAQRGYVSCVTDCPYDGAVPLEKLRH